MSTVADILLVEDNPKDITLTLSALQAGNVVNEVVVIRDGAEALDYLKIRGRYAGRTTPLPGVVLLDLKMPKVDGLEVLRQMRDDPNLKFIPVVMLTSSREERDIVASYRLGVNAYVVKPVDFDQFADAIRQLGLFWAVLNVPPSDSVKENKVD